MAEDSPVIQRRQQGHSRSYILDRLKRENQTDFINAIERGELSAFAAAVELGWIKRPPTLGGSNTHQARKRGLRIRAITDGGLSFTQLQELRLGPCGAKSVFASREELESAWQRARERLMASLSPGRRALAWWEFDSGNLKYPGYDLERSTLWRANLLSDTERTTLESEWKEEFARAQAPDFTLNDGSDEMLVGDCARAAYYRWADIPRELVKRWTARRRRGRQQRASLEEAAAIK